MPDADPIMADARRRRRETRFGGQHSCCLLCGEPELAALVRVPKRFLELHHLVDRATDPNLVVALCKNCHALVTARYQDAGVPTNAPENVLEKLFTILAAWGVFFDQLGDACDGWASELKAFIDRLDRELPRWRERFGYRTQRRRSR